MGAFRVLFGKDESIAHLRACASVPCDNCSTEVVLATQLTFPFSDTCERSALHFAMHAKRCMHMQHICRSCPCVDRTGWT